MGMEVSGGIEESHFDQKRKGLEREREREWWMGMEMGMGMGRARVRGILSRMEEVIEENDEVMVRRVVLGHRERDLEEKV